ncbi:kinase non-catalytic C-lobe domain-containing protein 1 [Megalops cyprinoides]|uniref:kinase non-catalytic C-lobe domain-containing protein 1 n=1 Tax=Megalops cyprinoides TaxID=118141 RepID=UPI001863D108|nr:kinase non-catalytic C-lobe domain-containing protein 1 [Megalops cyprinoides]
MGTFETAVSTYYEEEEEDEDEYYEFEPLPALLEDEENVSLADILSLRDSCLSEQEVWAVCLECVLALQSIAHSPLFHTLCITPDTLAFNAHGNVSFMEQLSDDPEGSFMPPEFDRTGNTFEGHVYSLGSTLAAALDFVIEPELEPELGPEARRLLDQMQQERPEDRPSLQARSLSASALITDVSSTRVCRKLSAIGRRVLSIESVGAFYDEPVSAWGVQEQLQKARRQSFERSLLNGSSSSEDIVSICKNHKADSLGGDAEYAQNMLEGRDVSLCADTGMSEEGVQTHREEDLFQLQSDSRSQGSSPVRRPPGRSGRPRGVLNRSSSVPDSNNPPALVPLHVNRNTPLHNLTEIGAEDNKVDTMLRTPGLHNSDHDLSAQRCSSIGNDGTVEFLQCSLDRNRNFAQVSGHSEWGPEEDSGQEPEVGPHYGVQNHKASAKSVSNSMYSPGNHMTKSMLCLKEESQDEWISLRELLCRCGRPLTVNELWALCHTCLSTLQTYIDFPAYLCLDSVYIGCEGEMLFLKPKNTGSCDPFYLAPEFQDHGIVTEKVCIYGVAAILWATAKFNLSPHQKLAMPRKLKRLLLEMAKRTPLERPSIVMAKKSCREFLSRQGTSAEVVWSKLIHRAHKSHHREWNAETQNALETMKMENHEESSHNKIGFVPCTGENGLSPVQGPVPHHYPITTDAQLPDAFTSPATHFTPIILTRDRATEGGSLTRNPVTGGSEHKFESTGDSHPDIVLNNTLAQGVELEEDDGSHSVTRESDSLRDCSSTSSSGKTLVNSLSPSPPLSSSQNTGTFGSFLLRQDPRTGLLTLFPVQISIPEPIPGLEAGLPPLSTSLPGQNLQAMGKNTSAVIPQVPANPKDCTVTDAAEAVRIPPPQNANLFPAGSGRKHSDTKGGSLGMEGGAQGGSAEPSPAQNPQIHPSLQGVIKLLREEFAFQGYLENGIEDRAMGEYIFCLRDLQHDTFCRAVSEKFCDLYWDEELLDALYRVVNKKENSLSHRDSSCTSSSNAPTPSKGQQRPAASPPTREGTEEGDAWSQSRDRRETSPYRPKAGDRGVAGPLDLGRSTGEDSPPDPSADVCESSDRAGIPCTLETQDTERAEDLPQHVLPDLDTASVPGPKDTEEREGSARGEMDSVECPVGGAVESPSDVESPWHARAAEGSLGRGQLSLDYSEDMEDTDSLTSMGGLQEEGRALGAEGQSCALGWALSFYGEDYFKEEVLKYAGKLARRSESPCLEAKMQELHQQLMMETRNLKKTRNFYHKLLHQERKNKGSEAKIMLSKLKIQMEEMRSKVEFLESVRKYLEVLCVDQWGLEVPLLASLAVSRPAPLELHISEDPSVLTFQPGTGRGCGSPSGTSVLLAGTPLGLMAYLYARNAPLEGYIQQFLYTYRYFCTPQEFLQFLMEKFISAAGREPSAEQVKVHHRTLDLLQAWLEDSQQVDFLPKSSLQLTLEEFLTTQVVPVDSRGEALLSQLKSPPRKRRSHFVVGCHGSPASTREEDDVQSVHSICRKSSIEDSGRKSFQWRISRVVEPQTAQPKEKTYSIAAALPRPCYSSLMDELSSSCLKSEERHPFYQSEHSAQHTAHQLTLLQQEIFQGCHPVHFLNSRAQGVRDKTVSVSKTLSPDSPPAEGSSLFASELMVQERYLTQLLKYADSITNWVSAEIVICDTLKAQAGLLSKFLLMAKYCYESRNFATAIQILGGLENVIVKQLPAWRHLSAKVCEILEELRAVQVFLKSDNLCLMEGERFKRLPTLPAAHILAMHIQQLEIGAFTLANGAYKWPKLRNIAKVVSQVRAFQEKVFTYAPDLELQAYLRHRIALLSDCDIPLLAAENDANFQISSERHSRKIQDTLRRVKATFQ